jgi:streptomycin 6-kinase
MALKVIEGSSGVSGSPRRATSSCNQVRRSGLIAEDRLKRRATKPGNRGDEWHSAEMLGAFQGNGVVRVYDYVEGAMLLERLSPGHSLASMAVSRSDDDATGVLAATINAMSPRPLRDAVPTVQDWGKGFERYAASGDTQIPKHLLSAAHQLYLELCASQTRVRLLHGDLHHGNVLFDTKRGWVAVDPKGRYRRDRIRGGCRVAESVRETRSVCGSGSDPEAG